MSRSFVEIGRGVGLRSILVSPIVAFLDMEIEKTTELPILNRMKLNIHASQTSLMANKGPSVLRIRERKVTAEGRIGMNRGLHR